MPPKVATDKFINDTDQTNLTSPVIVNLSNRLEKSQDRIELLSENKKAEFNMRSVIENLYYNIISEAQSISQNDLKVHNKLKTNLQNQSVKLPTIDLPTFRGNHTKWRTFQDTFNALINNNDSLSEVQKLCYLKSSVKGEAASVIQSIETTSDNYNIAFNLLKERFSCTRRIIYSNVYELLNLENFGVNSFIINVEQHLRSLESLNIEINKWDAILVPLITSKLDTKNLREWHKIFRYH